MNPMKVLRRFALIPLGGSTVIYTDKDIDTHAEDIHRKSTLSRKQSVVGSSPTQGSTCLAPLIHT